MDKTYLPSLQQVQKYFLPSDTFIREYYGTTPQDRLRTWAFRSRVKTVTELIKPMKPTRILDAGSGAFFIAYSIISKVNAEYVGIDIYDREEMKHYRQVMNKILKTKIDVIRASVMQLPFIEDAFDITVSMDVFEHLKKPTVAFEEVNRVTSGKTVLSLPLENAFQKLTRLPVLLSEGILKDPTSTGRWGHYTGTFKTYLQMYEGMLKRKCEKIKYVPIGGCRATNFYAIHLCKTKK